MYLFVSGIDYVSVTNIFDWMFEPRSGWGVQHYVIKFVSDLRQVGGFLRVLSTNKTDHHDLTDILLKLA